MPAGGKVTLLGALLAVVTIGAFIYIATLRSELGDAQRQMSSLQEQVKGLNETMTKIEAGRASVTSEREQLKTQLTEVSAKLTSLSEGNAKQIESLNQQLAALQRTVDYGNRVSGWWRDLFDYTKPFDGPRETTAGSAKTAAASVSK